MKPNEDGPHNPVTGLPVRDAVVSARYEAHILELESALADMMRQRDTLLNRAHRAQAWIEDGLPVDAFGTLSDAIEYCESLTPSDRARDAQDAAGVEHEAKVDRLLEQADERIDADPVVDPTWLE